MGIDINKYQSIKHEDLEVNWTDDFEEMLSFPGIPCDTFNVPLFSMVYFPTFNLYKIKENTYLETNHCGKIFKKPFSEKILNECINKDGLLFLTEQHNYLKDLILDSVDEPFKDLFELFFPINKDQIIRIE